MGASPREFLEPTGTVHLGADRVALCTAVSGLGLYDVSDPATPTRAGSAPLPAPAGFRCQRSPRTAPSWSRTTATRRTKGGSPWSTPRTPPPRSACPPPSRTPPPTRATTSTPEGAVGRLPPDVGVPVGAPAPDGYGAAAVVVGRLLPFVPERG